MSDSARVNAATGQMVAGIQKGARDAGVAERSLGQVGTRMRELGSQGIFLGAALTAPSAAALVLAVNFETAMTRISTLSGIAVEDIGELRDGLFEISKTSAQGPDELSRALLTITSTGKEGAEALEILEASAKASAIGLGETNEIARTITATVTAFASQGLTAAHAADVLFATVREGGAEVSEVAGTLGRVVGIAAQVGVSFEDVGAFIATFTRLGVGADEAVTALRGTLSTLINPSEQAATALADAGLSMEGLRQTAREKGLNEALRLIIEAFRGNEEALADVIPNVRALAGVLGTAGSQAEEFALVLDALRNSEGDLDEAFKTTAETNAFKFQQAIADIKREVIEAATVLLPALAKVLDLVGKLIDLFGALPTPVVAAGIALAGLTGIAVTLVNTMGLLVGSIAILASAAGLGGLGAAAAGAGAGLGAMGAGAAAGGAGLAGLTGAASSAAAAIGAVAVAAAPVIALGALVGGGIFAAALIFDKLAAESAADAFRELERVRALAKAAETAPEAPADPRTEEEKRLQALVERRKKLEEDIAAIRAGGTVETTSRFGPAIPRTERGLGVELADVEAQIAGRKQPTNIGVAAEELASLRQLRNELDQEATAFEATGRSAAETRLEIAKLDRQIRELSAGVQGGRNVAANVADTNVTKLRAEQVEQTEALTHAQERLNDVLGIEAPTAALLELTRLQESGTASTADLAAAQQKLNAAMGLTAPTAALLDLTRLQQSGTATTDQLTDAQRRLADAVAASGNPRAIAAFDELRAIQQDGSASADQLAAAQQRLNAALGLTPRTQALADYVALMQSGTATAAELRAAQGRLNDALGGRATAALAELTRLQSDSRATAQELAAAETELATALAERGAATEAAVEAAATAIADLIAMQGQGIDSAGEFADAQLRLQDALGVTPAGTALLELIRLQESGTASTEALNKAQQDLSAAVAASDNPAARTAWAEYQSVLNDTTATAAELEAALVKLQAALQITPAVASFARFIAVMNDSKASAYDLRQAHADLAKTLGAEGQAALQNYITLQDDASATDEQRAAALGTLASALVTASAATKDSVGAADEDTSAVRAQREAAGDLLKAYEQFPEVFRERQAAQEALTAALRNQATVEGDATSSSEDLEGAHDAVTEAGNRVADAEHAAADAIDSVSGAAEGSIDPVTRAAAAQRDLADALKAVELRKAAEAKKVAEQNRLRFLDETEALAAGPTETGAATPTASGRDLTSDEKKEIAEAEKEFWDGRVKEAEQAIRDAETAAREAASAHKRAIAEAEAAQRELERAFRESIPGRTIEAVNQARESRLQQQAEAVAREAFGLEGDSLGEVLATQQRANNAFQAVRDRLLALGVEIPESLLTMFDRMAEVAEDESKKTGEMIGGLLGFFIARQIGKGTPWQNLVSVPPSVQAQLATSSGAGGAGGGTVQEVNINGPITIGAGSTTGDVAHGVALAVRPAMSSL